MYAKSFVDILIFKEKCLVFLVFVSSCAYAEYVQSEQYLSLAEKSSYWSKSSLY